MSYTDENKILCYPDLGYLLSLSDWIKESIQEIVSYRYENYDEKLNNLTDSIIDKLEGYGATLEDVESKVRREWNMRYSDEE